MEHIDQNHNSPADEGGRPHKGATVSEMANGKMHSCAHRLLQNNIVRQKKMNKEYNQNLTQVEVSEAEPSQSRGNPHLGHCIAIATCSNV